jgi:hypothetical protein
MQNCYPLRAYPNLLIMLVSVFQGKAGVIGPSRNLLFVWNLLAGFTQLLSNIWVSSRGGFDDEGKLVETGMPWEGFDFQNPSGTAF